MSFFNAPFGFKPNFHTSGSANPRQQFGALPNPIAANTYFGQPVKLDVNGNLTPVTAATDVVAGIFAGVQYIQPNGFVKEQPAIAAGQPTLAVANNGSFAGTAVFPYLYQDTAMEFIVQANGPLTRAAVGLTFNIDPTSVALGNTTTGYSLATLDNVAADNGQFIVTELYMTPDNTWSDPFTVVRVKMNPAASNFS